MKVKVPLTTVIVVALILILLVLFVFKVLYSALVVAMWCLIVLTPIGLYLFRKRIWKYLTTPKQQSPK